MRKNVAFMTLLAIVMFAGCGSVSLFEKGNAARETDKVKARGYYEEACEKENHFEACHNAALLWQNGDGISEENKKARELFKKACDGKFDEAMKDMMNKPLDEIKELYNTREIEK